jgi:hypothetical protein
VVEEVLNTGVLKYDELWSLLKNATLHLMLNHLWMQTSTKSSKEKERISARLVSEFKLFGF